MAKITVLKVALVISSLALVANLMMTSVAMSNKEDNSVLVAAVGHRDSETFKYSVDHHDLLKTYPGSNLGRKVLGLPGCNPACGQVCQCDIDGGLR
ncbi:hypothetical protein ACH5RR_001511 [Cinchona calisaya]|uniref:Uncharacterized protein n=1 Tax=Cinchona calisaya TaxID=153742 RepID=A0ABD3B452_9GENT